MRITKYKAKSYIYLSLLIALSGNPFFGLSSATSQYFFSAAVLLLIFANHSFFNLTSRSSAPFFVYILLYILVFFLQLINLDYISVAGALGYLLKITFGYIVIRYLNVNFKAYYLTIIYYICVISLFGYSLNLMGVDTPDLLNKSEKIRSIIIYTQNTGDASQGIRNSGMFWEPGAFAGYICLLFLLHLKNIRVLVKHNKFKIFVIFITLLTTFSTTGYLVLFLIGLLTILNEFSSKYSRLFAAIGLFIFIPISINLFERLPFLGEKISGQFESASNLQNEFSNSRFGSFMFDMHYINKNPLTGNGLHEKTRYADHPWLRGEQLGHGNGFSNFIASMGILGFLIFAWYLIKFNTNSRWLFFIGIIVLLQGEQFLNFPLFLSLPFVFVYGSNYSRPSYVS